MIEKRTLKDYVFGVISGFLIMFPEAVKITISGLYLWVTWFVYNLDLSELTEFQGLGAVIMVMIGPVASYYFYEKSILKDLYKWILEVLIEQTSLISINTSDKRGDQNE